MTILQIAAAVANIQPGHKSAVWVLFPRIQDHVSEIHNQMPHKITLQN